VVAARSARRDQLGFVAARDGDPTYARATPAELLLVDARTGAERPLLPGRVTARGAVFAPDGGRVAVAVLEAADVWGLRVVEVAGGTVTPIRLPAGTLVDGTAPLTWSADGRTLWVATRTVAWRDSARARFATLVRGPVTALAGVDLDVSEGEFLSLLGPSGCGKSTLLRAIAGLDRLSEGSVRIRGSEVRDPPSGLGMVFQRDVLVDWRTILDNVLLAAEFQGLRRRDHVDRAKALLERFGLGAFADRHPWELSGGMRQRAAICRALLCEPQILLMDEPFGALDAMTRDDLNLELSRIQQDGGRTVVFVTHSIAEAVFLADRILLLSPRPGRIDTMIEVPFERPRPIVLQTQPEFQAIVRELRERLERIG
jgi:NitT/TauT family transport system ATP-binding protein